MTANSNLNQLPSSNKCYCLQTSSSFYLSTT